MIAALSRLTERLLDPSALPASPPVRDVARGAVISDRAPSVAAEGTFILLDVSRRKKTALFDLAARFCLTVEKAMQGPTSDPDSWNIAVIAQAAEAESRKSARAALGLLASRAHPETVWPALVARNALRFEDQGDRLEAEMVAAGAMAALRGVHPFVLMRVMASRLGQEYQAHASEWITDRLRRRKTPAEQLIVPGDLPELLDEISADPTLLELALRAAGREMSAAALSGCPDEHIKAAKACFGRIGGAVLGDSIRSYRARLSTDEIADAQAAFSELIRALKADRDLRVPVKESDDDAESLLDPDLVEDLSDLILELDQKLLKSIIAPISASRLAVLFPTMSPAARDRILKESGTMKESRIINALEDMDQMGIHELTREAQSFAQRVLAAFAPRGVTRGRQIPVPAKVRSLLSALLARE